ncbi:hypothetical protein Q0Z83_043610 [Actinoplanes sichuanensis]|uniref:Uncharacterized protein n=1 Tax=Actinoplanes sichuanensis TaxID=512349 RepID=A0ABW4AVZ4_9ACTN|nr:hypothetical protein [Actinoplanes sichuanensis]BEL06170.1 hypothetical protein Q0Z83_043610 [Actinoplanes sichuanensis]
MDPKVQAALARRTEWWLIHQGLPKFIAKQTLRTHTLPRMFPLLSFCVLTVPIPNDWLALAVATIGSAALWLVVTRAGRRPPPVLPRWVAALLLITYVAVPLGAVALEVAKDMAAVKADTELESDAAVQGFFAILAVIALGLVFAVANVATRYGLVSLVLHSVRHVAGDLRNSFGLLGRALPMLLFIVVFLFFTADIWQLANRIPVWRLAGICAMFVAVTLFAIAARLREEIRDIERSMAPDRLIAACQRTPLEAVAPALASTALLPPLRPSEQRNILLILGTRQLIRAAVVGVAVFGFFVVFGLVAVNQATAQLWTESTQPTSFEPAMVKVAALLAGFSVMYFAVSSMTHSEFRQRYFAGILDDVSRVLAVRAVYHALLQTPEPPETTPPRAETPHPATAIA